MRKTLIQVLALQVLWVCTGRAQAPTGALAGLVTDPEGGVIPATQIVITNRDTGLQRTLLTATDGEYSAPALLAGVYAVTAAAPGFGSARRDAIVEAGNSTTVNFILPLGRSTQTVTVAAASPQRRYECPVVRWTH